MKLIVISSMFVLMVAISASSAAAQASCKCVPQPPSGSTTCSRGEIAVCGENKGVCEAYCFDPDEKADGNAVAYTAILLSRILRTLITNDDLYKNSDDAITVINKLLTSNGKKPIDIEFKGKRKKSVNINLSPEARETLSKAIKMLNE